VSQRLEHLLDRLVDGLGHPLSPGVRRRIAELDSNPCPSTWNTAYSLCLGRSTPRKTLLTLVKQVDHRCPSGPEGGYALDNPDRWNGYYPEQLTLRIALRNAPTAETHGPITRSPRDPPQPEFPTWPPSLA
jgi:hypothetical protein